MMIIRTVLEALVMCLIYTAYIAWEIRKNAVPLLFLYPPEVIAIAKEHGLCTDQEIQSNMKRFLFISVIILIGSVIFFLNAVNHTETFLSAWIQIVIFIEFYNLYDAFVIDAWWVRKTDAWQIPYAEGMDYIPYGSKTKKRVLTAIAALPLAALIAWIFYR